MVQLKREGWVWLFGDEYIVVSQKLHVEVGIIICAKGK